MRPKLKQQGFALLTTVLVIISVFLIMHMGLSMRMQQKANNAHRGVIKLQTDWLARSAVEQALALFDQESQFPAFGEYEVALSPSYIAGDPLNSKEPDPRVFSATCSFSIEEIKAPLDNLNFNATEKKLFVSAQAKAPYRDSYIQSEVNMLCVLQDGQWFTIPLVE